MSVLNHDDRVFLGRFFEQVLELHAIGAVTTESATDYLVRATDAIDEQSDAALRELRLTLGDAWRDGDA